MLKWLSIIDKMHPDDANALDSNVMDKYKNRPDNLHSLCLADFAPCKSKKAVDVPIEPDESKSYSAYLI